MRIVRLAVVFIVAAFVGTILACVAHTQFVLYELGRLGVDVPIGDRVYATLHDIGGMGPTYGAILGIGFLVAFLVAGLIARFVPGLRVLIYVVAGGTAVAVALIIMNAQFEITPIAGARTMLGFAAQVGAGGVAGLVFSAMTPRR